MKLIRAGADDAQALWEMQVQAFSGLFEKYREELEYSVFYNVLLTSTDRVNLINPKSDVQGKLLEYMKSRFPDYEKNRYVREMGMKYRLLHLLIKNRWYGLLHTVLTANGRRKR